MLSYKMLHELLSQIVNYGVIFFEAAGISILLFSGLRGFYHYWTKNRRTHLELAHGMSMALGFMLGGEILRTVTSEGWKSSLNIGLLIILRASMTLLLHWEAKAEQKELEEEEQKEEHLSHSQTNKS